MQSYAMLIDGRSVQTSEQDGVINPAQGAAFATCPRATKAHVDEAVAAAARAYRTWRNDEAFRRQKLNECAGAIQGRVEEIARLLVQEQGKPLQKATEEVFGAMFWFSYFAGLEVKPEILQDDDQKRIQVVHKPLGVVAAITPWNFPIAMITRKVAPALAAGCTIVVKPAAETPLCALAVAKLGKDAGLPPGVLNIVTTKDAPAVGKVFCEDPRVRKLSFTGSTEVGKILYRQCADTVKKLTLELGGNAPLVVFDDADLEQAVAGAMASKYRNAGQTCVCANRILVQSGIYDGFAAALVKAVNKLTVGPGLEPGTAIGPLISSEAIAKVEALVSDAVKKGAKVLTGGTLDNAGPLFYRPSVVGDVTADMSIVQEEIFGPVAALVRFDTEADAVKLANDTPFGLAAYLFSQNLGRAWRVAEKLDVGMVGVNEGIFSNEVVPFGGVKESGLGREGGAEGLEEYLETKYICLGGIDA